MSITLISNKWGTAVTSQGHVTTAALKQACKEYIEGSFLSTSPTSQKVLRIQP